ncbi:hypothetical protein Ade02nite_37610 [Paractinoplanes deccanensis]|uniref:DUF304 domain-containing protein n=1 Tax=Paractinoplanes deccanensis TaxID=113561 RepID=A0ABQ3Y5G8_9ACTN|nr:hypothetical protein [Actinoplanes deccanensis]GID75120.1 hypothetical protein Ade02nite_37610 [Actinoplanes deccanensis]
MAHIDQVLGPDDDTLTFFQPRAMVFVTMLWVVAAVWVSALVLFVLLRLALGDPPSAGDLVVYLELALIVPVVAAALIMLLVWRRLGRLHTSMRGLDFAATGRRLVHLPWAGVDTVALRYRGPFTELIVVPRDGDFVEVLDGPGRPPRTRRRQGRTAYLVDVGLMSPGPEVLLAELHRRIPAKV